MSAAIVVALALAAVAPPHAESVPAPAPARAAVSQWRLSEVGGKVGCTVTLTDQATLGGHVLQAPPACHLAFPPLKDLSVWSTDPHGAPIFSDATHGHAVAFIGPVGGPFQAAAPDGKAWRLEAAPPRPVPAPPA
ncbi:MAG: AprI/Inh family metalloprotease inhibitor [Caulobacteraceae bacterium]